MSLGGPPEEQLMLLPARSAAEAATWGSVAMEYAAAFQAVHFARDPARVDWRGYQHVSIVRPRFWPDSLVLDIKQANPNILVDRIPADTPEALQLVLSARVYYGLRYGPHSEFDWKRLWPPGKSLIGLHGRSSGELEKADFEVARAARLEAVKITSHATPATIRQLRAINPAMFFVVRPYVSFGPAEAPRRVTPREFFDWTVNDVARVLDEDRTIRYLELHNEPNLRLEGLGGSWHNGAQFGDWFLEVLHRFRQRFPQALLGFPGLSPGPSSAANGRMSSDTFLDEAEIAAQQADWVGLHAYWVNEKELNDQALGAGFARYRERFPEKLLMITEFGNPRQAKHQVAEQYGRYYGMLRNLPGLGAAFAYVVSTPDAAESPLWAWRDEAGNDLGIAAEVGRRRHIRD